MPLTTYTAGEVLTAASLNANLSFAASVGGVVQVKSTTKTDTFTTASTSYTDITGLTVSITPTSASNKILIMVSVSGSNDAATIEGGVRLARGGTGIFVGNTAGSRTIGNQMNAPASSQVLQMGLIFLDSPATTSATTYSVQCINVAAGTFYVNRCELDTDVINQFRAASSITVIEVKP